MLSSSSDLSSLMKNIEDLQLKGTIKIDETLFGKCQKYHKGKPSGMKVWLLGMLERNGDKNQQDRIIVYPVAKRVKETLLCIIQHHVSEGETIYSDNWPSYSELTDLGYKHFTVCHKYNYLKVYREESTGMS